MEELIEKCFHINYFKYIVTNLVQYSGNLHYGKHGFDTSLANKLYFVFNLIICIIL